MRAVVCFHNHGCHVLDPLLKRGFRHVFCALESGDCWIMIDGRAGVMVIEAVAPAGYDLATFYRAQGFTVIETNQGSKPLRTPLVASNCVGFVKAVLGIRCAAVTPWRLYKHLLRRQS